MDDESRDMAVMVALRAGLGTGLAPAGGGGGLILPALFWLCAWR